MWTTLRGIYHTRMRARTHTQKRTRAHTQTQKQARTRARTHARTHTHTELSIHTSSSIVVSLLQHAICWWIVETWALHVCCSCWLTAICLVHTVWSIQWHYPLFTPASCYQALISLPVFLFWENKVGLPMSLACCVLCAVCCVPPFGSFEPVNQNPCNVVPTPCHYTPNWHTYLFLTICNNMVAMWTCQMGVSGQVHLGSCIMDGNRHSKSVSLLFR